MNQKTSLLAFTPFAPGRITCALSPNLTVVTPRRTFTTIENTQNLSTTGISSGCGCQQSNPAPPTSHHSLPQYPHSSHEEKVMSNDDGKQYEGFLEPQAHIFDAYEENSSESPTSNTNIIDFSHKDSCPSTPFAKKSGTHWAHTIFLTQSVPMLGYSIPFESQQFKQQFIGPTQIRWSFPETE